MDVTHMSIEQILSCITASENAKRRAQQELASLRALVLEASVWWEENNDGHRCARGYECGACRVIDAIHAVQRAQGVKESP